MSSIGRVCLLAIPLAVGAAFVVCAPTCVVDRAAGGRVEKSESFREVFGWHDSDEEIRSRHLLDALMQRWSAKQRVRADLLAHRITLLEAAARFRDLHLAGPPFDWDTWQFALRRCYPNASNDERICRYVIEGMQMMLSDGSEEARPVMERLGRELDEHLQRGTLRLRPPAPPPEPTTVSLSAPCRQYPCGSACR